MSREDRDAQLKDVYVVQPEIVRMEDSMEERGSRLAVVKGKMDRVEDEVFQDFCREIGVANIRCCLSSLLHPPPLHCYIHNCADTTIQPPHTQKPPHSHHHTHCHHLTGSTRSGSCRCRRSGLTSAWSLRPTRCVCPTNWSLKNPEIPCVSAAR